MKRKSSSFDRIKAHLVSRGSNVPANGSMRDDLEMLVRRCDEVRSLGREFGQVELSPYMSSLLRVSTAAPAKAASVRVAAAASV